MAVRDALLALLTIGPAYGFQLHGGIAVRTGGRRTVNVGQTYATLERLAKQRLIEPAGTTADGLPLHRLTETGTAAAAAWLDGADAAGSDPWDETVDRVLVARSLPGYDADGVLAGERARWEARRDAASTLAAAGGSGTIEDDPGRGPAELGRLAATADLARAEAALSWLDAVDTAERVAFAPTATRPRRGRPPAERAEAVSPDTPHATAIA